MRFKPPQKAKRDANEGLIVQALEAHGFEVERMDKPVDLLIQRRGGDRVWLGEVKAVGARRDPRQVKQNDFLDAWPVTVLRTVEDVQDFAALTAIGVRTVIKGVNDA